MMKQWFFKMNNEKRLNNLVKSRIVYRSVGNHFEPYEQKPCVDLEDVEEYFVFKNDLIILSEKYKSGLDFIGLDILKELRIKNE